MGLFTRSDREAFGVAATVFALLAMLLSFGALVAVAQDDDGGGVAAGGVSVQLTEFMVMPATISVAERGTLTVTNAGTAPHNLGVEGHPELKTPDLQPGDAANLDVGDLAKDTYTVFCSIAGHREAGMVATLNVGGGGAGAGGIPQGAGGVSPEQLLEENDAADAAQKDPVDEYLALFEKNGQETGPPLLEPTVLADGTKRFDITAEIAEWEVEPGKLVAAWTYNGTVPGPTIKVAPNDKVRIVLHNDLPQSTAIHLHGIETPNAMDGVPWVTQDPVEPGDSFTYEFVATGPAVGMYHSHHHAEHQVPDGLVGALLVGDMPLPAGQPAVDQEIPLVLNDAGVIGLSLNGKSFPGTKPIVAAVGETVEIQYFNEGLQIHPMHLHGIPQLVIAKDGFPLPQPYRVDTLNVAPGERYTVLVTPTEAQRGANGAPGVWAFHCHILTHAEAEDGMFGMVTTFIVT